MDPHCSLIHGKVEACTRHLQLQHCHFGGIPLGAVTAAARMPRVRQSTEQDNLLQCADNSRSVWVLEVRPLHEPAQLGGEFNLIRRSLLHVCQLRHAGRPLPQRCLVESGACRLTSSPLLKASSFVLCRPRRLRTVQLSMPARKAFNGELR